MNDAELVQQTLDGEIECFGQIVNRHRGMVQSLAYHQVRNFEAAQDIAQETFITAYLKLGQLRQPECFAAWLRQLTLNHCRKWIKRQKTLIPFAEIEAYTSSPKASPVQTFEDNEMRRLVHQSLQKLPDNNRLVLTLHYLGSMSYRQIAAFLDVPLSTVEGRMHRAKQQVKGNIMKALKTTLDAAQLDDDFTRKILAQAQKRASETRAKWQRAEFELAIQQGLEAARALDDPNGQIDMLSMLGAANATWLGAAETAVANYEAALPLARQQNDNKGEARLLAALYQTHLRHGDWEKLQQRAGEALKLYHTLNDSAAQAMAQAALDLAELLPPLWHPNQAGGYAIAAFPVDTSAAGYRWGDPLAVRNYSWGCPSRCAALVHLFRPQRFLGPDLALGTQWEDLVDHKHYNMSWDIDPADPEPLARSRIEAVDAKVDTPAGHFSRCLQVETAIAIPGQIATEHRTRSFCGSRIAWFAPGVGLVKLRHTDQNGFVWTVSLVAHEGPPSTAFFPLEPGHMWRYRWAEGSSNKNLFEDICRVVSGDDDLSYLSSATCAVEQSEEEILAYLTAQLALAQSSDDLVGQATTLEAIIPYSPGNEPAYRQQLLALYQEQGDPWKLLLTQQAQQQSSVGTSPDQTEQALADRLELARRLADSDKEAETLIELASHHLNAESYTKAAQLYEAYGAIHRASGDLGKTAQGISLAELARALQTRPEDQACGYTRGDGILRRQKESLKHLGSGRSSRSKPFPPGPRTTPMTDFLWLCPFDGSEILHKPVGESCTGWLNTGLGGICESMRVTSILKSKEEKTTTPAGRFSDCALVETTISTSAEERPLDEADLTQARQYFAGTKQTWFAPGVGVVKLLYQHQNGLVTTAELLDYEIATPDNSYIPLALDNRWHYNWTDPASGTQFDDWLRLAAQRQDQWNIAFVTRAVLAEPVAQTALDEGS